MYGVFFDGGDIVPRIKEERKGISFNVVVWEPEFYKTKDDAEAKAEAIRMMGFPVVVKEV